MRCKLLWRRGCGLNPMTKWARDMTKEAGLPKPDVSRSATGRRSFSEAEKRHVVDEALQFGVSLSQVARRPESRGASYCDGKRSSNRSRTGQGARGLGITDMPQGRRWAGDAGLGRAAPGPAFLSPVRVPRPPGRPDQDRVLGWRGPLSAHQATGAEPRRLACGRDGGTGALMSAQPSMLIDGIDWRIPERRWQPASAG